MKIWLDPNAPNTNFIMGAVFSGGNPLQAAKLLSPSEAPMARKFDLEFRGKDMTVVVDQYEVDYDTNALDVEWHFAGVGPAEHSLLCITDQEENKIVEAIGEYLGDLQDDDDHRDDRFEED
jgi:hypothetical protein